MADLPQTKLEPPAPLAPSATPAASGPLKMADPDSYVEVKVNHEKKYVPVKEYADSFQLKSVLEQKYKQLNDMKVEYERSAANSQKWADFKSELDRDPRATLEQVARHYGIRLPSADNSASTDDPDAPAHQAGDPRVEKLERELAQLRKAHTSAETKLGIAQALDEHTLFKQDPVARRQAERFLAAALVQNPQAPLRDLAIDIHTDLVDIVKQNATTTFNQRLQDRETHAGLPAQSGTPAMTDPPAAPTLAGWKSGKDKALLQAHFDNLRARSQGRR